MEIISGTIDNIYTKTVTIKRGPRAGSDTNVYHAVVNGHDVNLGFKCQFEEGESVSWECDHAYGEYKYVGASTGKTTVPNASNNGVDTGANKRPAPTTRAAFPIDKNSKEMSIIRQNRGQHASRLVASLIQMGEIQGTEQAMDAFFEIVYQITDFATGHREEAQAKAMSVLED